MDGDCLFCRIAAGDIPSSVVYENDRVLAFLDIHPVNAGHTLVIPKKHSRNALSVPENEWLEIMRTVRLLAQAIHTATGADGMNIITNNESAGHQLVFHTHVHIIPRFKNDGFKLSMSQGTYKEGEAEEVLKRIRDSL